MKKCLQKNNLQKNLNIFLEIRNQGTAPGLWKICNNQHIVFSPEEENIVSFDVTYFESKIS